MDINGKLIKTLPMVTGQSSRGTWNKQEFVIETQDAYPKSACFSLWGDKTDQLAGIQVGEMIKVYFSVESREYNDRWYTELRAFRVDKADMSSAAATQPGAPPAAPRATPSNAAPAAFDGGFSANGEADDLPF